MYESAVAKDLAKLVGGPRGQFEVDRETLLNMVVGNYELLMELLQEEAKKHKQEIVLQTLWDLDYQKLVIRWYPKET